MPQHTLEIQLLFTNFKQISEGKGQELWINLYVGRRDICIEKSVFIVRWAYGFLSILLMGKQALETRGILNALWKVLTVDQDIVYSDFCCLFALHENRQKFIKIIQRYPLRSFNSNIPAFNTCKIQLFFFQMFEVLLQHGQHSSHLKA